MPVRIKLALSAVVVLVAIAAFFFQRAGTRSDSVSRALSRCLHGVRHVAVPRSEARGDCRRRASRRGFPEVG